MTRMRLCYGMLSLISKPGSKDPKATKTNTPLLSVCIADLCWSLRRSRVSNTIPRAALPSWALPLPGAPRSGWSWWPQPRTELAPGGFPTAVPCSTTKMATQQDCWHLTLSNLSPRSKMLEVWTWFSIISSPIRKQWNHSLAGCCLLPWANLLVASLAGFCLWMEGFHCETFTILNWPMTMIGVTQCRCSGKLLLR